MKIILSALIALCLLAATSAFAGKPDRIGKEKPAKEHLKAMDSKTEDAVEAMKEKGKVEREKIENKARDLGKTDEEELEDAQKKMKGTEDKIKTMDHEKKGLEKHRKKKAEQVQKELDKGSEKGQEARQKRKKWWKLWE